MLTPERIGDGQVMARLMDLDIDELAMFSRCVDAALLGAPLDPADIELADAASIAAAARILLRDRRARAAGERAKDLVRQLISTETIE